MKKLRVAAICAAFACIYEHIFHRCVCSGRAEGTPYSGHRGHGVRIRRNPRPRLTVRKLRKYRKAV